MTDTFASRSSTPGGQPSNETAGGASDVTGGLAELERKLRELERELTSIGRRREPAPGEQAEGSPARATHEPPAPRAPGPPGRLVDETLEPPVRPAAPAPPFRPSPPARPRPSEAQLASLAELRRFRDRLERFARELTSEYDALLGRVMAGLSSAQAQPEPTTPEPLRPEPLRPDPEAPSPAQSAPSFPPSHVPPVPASPPAQSVSSTPPAPEDALFEGRVELGVGPFYDIASLGAFERQLASLPGVGEASVRRFEASHAVVDVRLVTPIALLRELRRGSQGDFSVREIAAGRILLTFDDA